MRFAVACSVAVLATSVAASARAADADDPASAARQEAQDRRAQAGWMLAGSAALVGLGTAATISGAWPCPRNQDCSTRPLGVVLGAPMIGVGAVLAVGAAVKLATAAAYERAAAEGTAGALTRRRSDIERVAAARARRAELSMTGTTLVLGGAIVTAASAALVVSAAGPCAAGRGCAGAGPTIAAGSVLAAGGAGMTWVGESRRVEAERTLRVAPYVTAQGAGLSVGGSF